MTGHFDSYYSRTLVNDQSYPKLDQNIETEICVIGGGLAGLAVALGLVERGKKVVLLEARRIGWGASGRNGGFCLSGYAAPMETVIRKAGLENGRALFRLSKDAQALIRQRIDVYDIPCDPVDGSVVASWYDDADAVRKKRDFLCDMIGEHVEFWTCETTREFYNTKQYHQALFFPENFHMHPLRYALGIAHAVAKKGGCIFEGTAAARVKDKGDVKIVSTEAGEVTADEIVFCGSAYFINDLHKTLARSCLKVATYVMVTEPIEKELLHSAIRAPYAIRDTRYADDYYRPLPDGRLLWGGRISISRDPYDLAGIMRRDMIRIYPQLETVQAETAWSGLMGYTVHRMPHIGQFAEGIWYCTNFGGNGVGPTTAGGEVIARAIAERDETYKLFEPFGFQWTGGPLGTLAAQMVYRSWEMRDWLGDLRTN